MSTERAELLLELPRTIDLTGIEPYQTFAHGHDQYRNSHGTLYVACDNQPRYWPADERLDDFRNGFTRLIFFLLCGAFLRAFPHEALTAG